VEFAVLAPPTEAEGALAVAERFRAGVEGLTTEWEGKPIPAQVSVGVATLEGEDDTVEGLVGRADRALYAAKEGGRNRVVTFSGAAENPSPP
jgi:two-component system chemotaxis family response regulator WspR